MSEGVYDNIEIDVLASKMKSHWNNSLCKIQTRKCSKHRRTHTRMGSRQCNKKQKDTHTESTCEGSAASMSGCNNPVHTWGIVDITGRRTDVDATKLTVLPNGKGRTPNTVAPVSAVCVIKYEVLWELGARTWETRTSWLTDWDVNVASPFLPVKQIYRKMNVLDKRDK